LFSSFEVSICLTSFLFFGFKLSKYGKNKNKHRGFAFVEMDSPEEALAALNSLQSYVCKPNITFTIFYHVFHFFDDKIIPRKNYV
jgi:RNA recognition motif-containing protein